MVRFKSVHFKSVLRQKFDFLQGKYCCAIHSDGYGLLVVLHPSGYSGKLQFCMLVIFQIQNTLLSVAIITIKRNCFLHPINAVPT